MSIKDELLKRANSACELCKSEDGLEVLELDSNDISSDKSVLLCAKCQEEFAKSENYDENHWFCLSDSMWSEENAVKVASYRMIKRLNNQDLLDMIYLEDDVKSWADENLNDGVVQKDSNGVVLNAGDTVTLIKDLDVKGAGFTAKRGTAVRNISLTSNPDQIEGRVNGVKIVILTQFTKKA